MGLYVIECGYEHVWINVNMDMDMDMDMDVAMDRVLEDRGNEAASLQCLHVVIELFRRRVWEDNTTVNVISAGRGHVMWMKR